MLYPQYQIILAHGNAVLYKFFVIAAAVAGYGTIFLQSKIWPIPSRQRFVILVTAAYGAMIGSAIPAFVSRGAVASYFDHIEPSFVAMISGPKTILGGLIFSFVCVAIVKKIFRWKYDTSDEFALGTTMMLAIGRWGCVFYHCCFGARTLSRFAVDLGDGIPRYPIQIVEALGSMCTMGFAYLAYQNKIFRNQLLFIVFFFYGAFRFLLEYFREQVATPIGFFGFYQWMALLLMFIGLFQIAKRQHYSTTMR